MRDQLRHLRKVAERPNVVLQVIPFSAGAHAGTGVPFILLRFPDNAGNIVYLEDLTTASYVDDPGHLANYELVFRHLLAAALSPSESANLLDTVAREL
ncbi:hypothetical protein GTS_48610 [Gandjariella thermophila]|uniref:DUF5753 domain-containing protein n=1 Tax=Gandjariella thermophila TaxID=1931992 RepID=A0A4D4JEZ8_9PSEU|nr:hypothetical protein GTS_48610 [Gandjariella thermophila]